MTRAEKRARKATHAARRVVAAHAEVEQRVTAVINGLSAEVEHLRETQERFRGLLFGAFLGRALGDEPTVSDALMAAHPGMFRGHEEAPWMALSTVAQ